jgi:diketogulonate reductase-like aldo/keto reductase
MTGKSPTIALGNGVEMPALGLGVLYSNAEETAQVVAAAIGEGYRLIDTAAAYFNETQVGEGLVRSGIDRAEMFITTKLWLSDYGYDRTLHGFDRSLHKLGLDQLDLYLLHWPVPTNFGSTLASYKAAARLLRDGRVRAIGVCNFGVEDLERLIGETGVVPAVNQVELHPFVAQPRLREAHARFGIVTQAWSPIGGVNRYWAGNAGTAPDPLTHPVIVGLADRHGRTPAQVILRWHIQHGTSAIPKSVRRERIAENIDIFDFELSPGEMAAIDGLDAGRRGGPDPGQVNLGTFDLTVKD